MADPSSTPETVTAASCWRRPGLLLMLAMLVSMSSKSLPNVFAGLMAIGGVWAFARAPRRQLADPLVRVLLVLFGSLWLPMVLALPDAIQPGRALETTLPYLRFLGLGLFVIDEARRAPLSGPLTLGLFGIVTFWCLDALGQFAFGTDLFGLPGADGSIYGVFYPEITLGHVAAALSPWYFHALNRLRARAPWVVWLLIPFVLTILLSQRRAAWIMLAVGGAGYVLLMRRTLWRSREQRRRTALAALALLATVGIAIWSNAGLQTRLQQTLGLFSGDYATANLATASRFNLWETGWRMFGDHWFNGIGPRGYRFAYPDYSPPTDIFHVHGQTHPHQLVLEVLIETGVLGLAGLVVFVATAIRFLRAQRPLGEALPGVLAVIAATFPLNTHMAFYGSYWGCLVWWLIASTLAALAAPRVAPPR